jgi:8-oxo-dGTP pyrophosphatase MutT (NUDIX family)
MFELVNLDELEKLSEMLHSVSDEQDADAAVVLLLRLTNQGFKLLLVKRVENPSDPWSGQMAFPGGKRDSEDENLKQTVIRETREETGINLGSCRFLGVTAVHEPAKMSELKILPYVALLEPEQSIRLNPKELECFIWVSLEELVQHRQTVRFNFGEYSAYKVGNNIVWGLTYRIIEDFLQILNNTG